MKVLPIGGSYCSGNCLEDFCKVSEFPARNLKPGPPECEAEVRELPYYFEIKMPNDLTSASLLKIDFREWTIIKMQPICFSGATCPRNNVFGTLRRAKQKFVKF
jgi:hypothetical protein